PAEQAVPARPVLLLGSAHGLRMDRAHRLLAEVVEIKRSAVDTGRLAVHAEARTVVGARMQLDEQGATTNIGTRNGDALWEVAERTLDDLAAWQGHLFGRPIHRHKQRVIEQL